MSTQVPEVATLTITGGAKPGSYSQKQHRDWEVSVLKLQMALEDNFRDIAEKCSLSEGRHAVLLMDRGTMDVLAYVGKDAFDDVCARRPYTPRRRLHESSPRRSSRSLIGPFRNYAIKDMRPWSTS